MDREKPTDLIKDGPVRINMDDGRSFHVAGPEMATASDIAAAVLYRADEGKYRHIHLPLVTMTSVEPLGNGAEKEKN